MRRAVRDAASFLTRAHAITIISINEAQEASNAPAATLAAHLARHGLTTQIERGSADRADIQPTILSIAADKGLDLIVMGGWAIRACKSVFWAELRAACFKP